MTERGPRLSDEAHLLLRTAAVIRLRWQSEAIIEMRASPTKWRRLLRDFAASTRQDRALDPYPVRPSRSPLII
jgi:hypothetical protein